MPWMPLRTGSESQRIILLMAPTQLQGQLGYAVLSVQEKEIVRR